MLILLSVIVVLLCWLHFVLNYNQKARQLRTLPGPRDVFIFGNLFLVLFNTPVQLFQTGRNLAKQFNGIYRWWSFGLGVVNVYHPADAEIILSTTKYNEKSIVYSFLKPWLKEGLLLSEGSKWRHRRRILTPAFHFNILNKFSVILEENSRLLVNVLEKTNSKDVDITPIVTEFTLHSICETAMGIHLGDDISERGMTYKEAIYGLGKIMVERFIMIPYYVNFIFNHSSLGKSQTKYLNVMHDFTRGVIEERKKTFNRDDFKISGDINENEDNIYMSNKRRKVAMLDLLILAQRDNVIDDQGIQEEVDTFMFEGHDTTSSGLTFCFMEIANNKDIQDRIYNEINGIVGDSDRTITMEDTTKMKYLECCIKESLRLYPPVPFIGRVLDEPATLSNYTIPAGVFCHIHIFDLHRQADLFEDPLKFDPDRFLPENSVGRHPYSYIPFSAGPRNCIGQRFAMLEMKLAVAAVLRKYRLLPVTRPEDLVLECDLVLRNSRPVYINFVDRQ